MLREYELVVSTGRRRTKQLDSCIFYAKIDPLYAEPSAELRFLRGGIYCLFPQRAREAHLTLVGGEHR
jgi:hypothetical protein